MSQYEWGSSGSDDGNGVDSPNPKKTFKLGGKVAGWRGRAPNAIEEKSNPARQMTTEMASYYCEYHPESMRGKVAVSEYRRQNVESLNTTITTDRNIQNIIECFLIIYLFYTILHLIVE